MTATSAALKLVPQNDALSEKSRLGQKPKKLQLVWSNPHLTAQAHKEKSTAKPNSSYGRVVYNYFRDYDSSTGRYLESDPIGLEGGLNTYGYVGQNPLSRVDPRGLVEWTGDFSIKTASYYLGVVWGNFDLVSECDADGQRKRARINVFGGIGDLGFPPGSDISGRITLEDGKLRADPQNLTGLFSILTLGPTVGKLSGLTRIGLGDAGAQDVEVSGLDVSAISMGFGHASLNNGSVMPLNAELEDCGCSQ